MTERMERRGWWVLSSTMELVPVQEFGQHVVYSFRTDNVNGMRDMFWSRWMFTKFNDNCKLARKLLLHVKGHLVSLFVKSSALK
jgi:hypothetical protein